MGLKRIELDLYIYDGVLTTNRPDSPQYEINKARIDTHNKITLEIGIYGLTITQELQGLGDKMFGITIRETIIMDFFGAACQI